MQKYKKDPLHCDSFTSLEASRSFYTKRFTESRHNTAKYLLIRRSRQIDVFYMGQITLTKLINYVTAYQSCQLINITSNFICVQLDFNAIMI